MVVWWVTSCDGELSLWCEADTAAEACAQLAAKLGYGTFGEMCAGLGYDPASFHLARVVKEAPPAPVADEPLPLAALAARAFVAIRRAAKR